MAELAHLQCWVYLLFYACCLCSNTFLKYYTKTLYIRGKSFSDQNSKEISKSICTIYNFSIFCIRQHIYWHCNFDSEKEGSASGNTFYKTRRRNLWVHVWYQNIARTRRRNCTPADVKCALCTSANWVKLSVTFCSAAHFQTCGHPFTLRTLNICGRHCELHATITCQRLLGSICLTEIVCSEWLRG